ncbi:hypothetical protein [Spirilliplanes yamanashiensis]|uniref:Uncharacterized protein n=1 Tax=Spirilliplanes yamanashiensis TaxID=42233 RepID=A0A8J3YB99_9ACTN|nr:hypothetical protein [Spirilliplanes yamanashiensis]MDP9817758.1 hypothetical protein [Spirilliplanes yamanashiensis]GIJ04568.1 hypothetical protein Sya03_39200 [Spirilliplanes yamanashiensis]
MTEQNRSNPGWGTSPWAWGVGLPIGMIVGIALFDSIAVAVIAGLAIGTAFAIAFGAADRARRDRTAEAPPPGPER